MTLDEAIAKHRKIAETQKALYDACVLKECNKHFLRKAEEHEQLAEWLEELKEMRSMVKCNAFTDGYNKGIDDFFFFVDKMEREDVLYYAALDEAAEQLKEGDNHGH